MWSSVHRDGNLQEVEKSYLGVLLWRGKNVRTQLSPARKINVNHWRWYIKKRRVSTDLRLMSVDVCLMDSVLASDVKFQLKVRFNHFWQPVSLRKSCIAHILWPAELFTWPCTISDIPSIILFLGDLSRASHPQMPYISHDLNSQPLLFM